MCKMRASLVVFFVLATYSAFKESHASEAYNALYEPVFLTFPEFKFSEYCAYDGIDVSLDYRRATYNFAVDLFKLVALRSNLHAVYSPMSLWRMLAAMAEGAEGPAQHELFKVLSLPEDKCLRQKYYQLAAKSETAAPDVTLLSTRLLAYDESLDLNKYWADYVRSNCLMNTIPIPIKREPLVAQSVMRNLVSSRLPLADFSGNSVILDSLDYQALWTTAFSDAIIENAPFCNEAGQQIGTVDLMKMKKRVRMTFLPGMNLKVLELPVGYDGRYRMMFALSLSKTLESLQNFRNTIVFETLDSLRTSRIPIDIAIPRFTMTSEYDMRPFLEEMGVRSLWADSYATRNISEPAAKPSALLQRVTITLDNRGVLKNSEEIPEFLSASAKSFDTETGLDPILGRDFIANRPFMFGLLDMETKTVSMGTIFSYPTTKFVLKK